MPLFFKLFLLISVVKLTVDHDPLRERPLFIAVLYTLGNAFLESLVVARWGEWLIRSGLVFLLSWLYFWLLSKLEDAGVLWWLICLLGVPIILL
jgi:hypothetical protein